MKRCAGLWMLVCLAACDDAEVGAAGEVAACVATAPTLDHQRLRAVSSRLVDAAGRDVLLRGVNAGGRSKLPPFFPFPFAEAARPDQPDARPFAEEAAAYAERIRAWGLNVARVPFTWEALEPTRGRYDDAYLDRYAALVQALGERGIRVIVDFHQDVYHRVFCGDGFPDWALPDADYTMPPDCSTWFSGYLSNPDVQLAYDRFWANEDGLRDAFKAMWEHVATSLWPEPNVIGFEIMNEPGWGTADPARWAQDVLAPFYGELADALHAIAPDALIFVDATGTEAITARTALPRPPGAGLVFAPHFYDAGVILRGVWSGADGFEEPLGRWADVGRAWGVPVLIGEYGIPAAADGAAAYVAAHQAALDALGLHGTLWEYSATVDDWNGEGMSIYHPDRGEAPTAGALARPYPEAVAGTDLAFTYDSDQLLLRLSYDATPGGTTTLRVPDALFTAALRAEITEGDGCLTAEGGRVHLYAPHGGRVSATLMQEN
ncbi:MAG: cellulase family glycosylhydrolase [bacterium]